MKTKTSEARGLLTQPAKTPWHLRFAPTANGVVSLVQNLLPSLPQKEASATAAVLAGIGLLCAPIEKAQANHGDLLLVSEVILTDWEGHTSSNFDIEIVHSDGSGATWFWPKYCWSGFTRGNTTRMATMCCRLRMSSTAKATSTKWI